MLVITLVHVPWREKTLEKIFRNERKIFSRWVIFRMRKENFLMLQFVAKHFHRCRWHELSNKITSKREWKISRSIYLPYSVKANLVIDDRIFPENSDEAKIVLWLSGSCLSTVIGACCNEDINSFAHGFYDMIGLKWLFQVVLLYNLRNERLTWLARFTWCTTKGKRENKTSFMIGLFTVYFRNVWCLMSSIWNDCLTMLYDLWFKSSSTTR